MGKNILDGYLDQGTNNSVYYEKYLEETENNKTNTMVYPFLMDDVKTATYNTNLIWKNDFELVKGIDPNLLVEARKNSQNNPYEMDCISRLYQSKMKSQCRTYKTAWETDNEKLSELANTFSSSQTSIEMEGDTANNIWELFSDYCAIIQCMQMGILFDLEDNNALYNRLGDVDLDGSVILHGIESARTNYSIECTARDNSISAAISTSDEDFSRWLWSEARRHGDLAHSYYDEWMHYEDLKREYEEINAFSMKFYLTGVEYRTLAQEGMDILATAYDGSGNYIVPAGFAGWRTQFDEKNKAKLIEYASKWKDENGEWDYDKFGETFQGEADSIKEVDCLALEVVFDSMQDSEKELFIESAYKSEFIPFDRDPHNGYWKHTVGPAFITFASYYGQDMDIIKDANKDVTAQTATKIRNYQLLYSYAVGAPIVEIPGTYTENGNYNNGEAINITIGTEADKTFTSFVTYDYKNNYQGYTEACENEIKKFTLYPYMYNLYTPLHDAASGNEETIINLNKPGFNSFFRWGVETGVGAKFSSNPVVGGILLISSLEGTAEGAANGQVTCDNVSQIVKDMERANVFDKLDCQGAFIVDSDNNVYFPVYTYPHDTMQGYLEQYNAENGNVIAEADINDVLKRALTDSDFANSAEVNSLFNYIEKQESSDDNNQTNYGS